MACICLEHWAQVAMVPRGLEPRTLRLLAVRSNQLSYETLKTQQSAICILSNVNASIGDGREKGGSLNFKS